MKQARAQLWVMLCALALGLGGALAAAAPAWAQDAADFAHDAARQLQAAQVRLTRADGARDRVAALTDTVLAFETGLSAAREGLRRAVIREAELARRLAAQEIEITRLLGALQGMSRAGSTETALHPDGP
ncbi:MAG: peptidase M23, partial [Paracoccaceae bacterium]